LSKEARKPPYWGRQANAIIGASVAVMALLVLYDLVEAQAYEWYLLGTVAAALAFSAILQLDKRLRPGLMLHHLPEVPLLFFVGYLLGVSFHLSGSYFLLVAFPAFYAVSTLFVWAVTMVKRPFSLKGSARGVFWFWVTFAAGAGAGALIH
jgi:hypothetical protein